MSLKNKLFKEMFKMSSPAAQQAGTKAPSHNLSCWIQPNSPKSEKSRPNPTHGLTQPMDNSGWAILAHLTLVTNRQTTHATSVTIGCILCNA